MKNVHIVNLNNYVRPNPVELLQQSKQEITNGESNQYFYYLQNLIIGSPTLNAIVDAYVNYTVAEGLEDINKIVEVENILSREDLELIVNDFKATGNAAIQVVYQLGNPEVVAKLYHVNVASIAIKKQTDLSLAPNAYWYSADWRLKTKFRPVEIPAYGNGDGQSEILYIRRPSAQPLFSLPDWQSAAQFAAVEEELSNYYSNHIQNNFSAGTIVNINQGATAESDEAKETARREIVTKLTGTSNAGRVIVSFNDNAENRTTVDQVAVQASYNQFQFLTQECREKIMLANGVVDPALFGFANASGFSSQSDQMITSLKLLYRNRINPIRTTFIRALSPLFKTINSNCELQFKDFEEVRVTKPE
jgi:hypothetical protein